MEKETKEYKAGFDAGYNSPNGDNCNILHFSTKEKTKEWERGNTQGKLKKLKEEFKEKII